jgi:hypothetical protein
MAEPPRKKSPRAPSLALDEAIEKVLKAYDKERVHPAPTEVVAQNIGYKSANNGAALGALASLRYFGLLERPKDGYLAVTREAEAYKFAPEQDMKRSILMGFLRRPVLYAELLEKYSSGLPSDANLRFELIQRGFAPQAAESALAAFRRSVEFAGYFDLDAEAAAEQSPGQLPVEPDSANMVSRLAPIATSLTSEEDNELDKIPVRLPGGRRAWLLIPTPFYTGDKDRLKAQIDLLLTDEDE